MLKTYDTLNDLLANDNLKLTITHTNSDWVEVNKSNLNIAYKEQSSFPSLTFLIDDTTGNKERTGVFFMGNYLYLGKASIGYDAVSHVNSILSQAFAKAFVKDIREKANKTPVWKYGDAFILLSKNEWHDSIEHYSINNYANDSIRDVRQMSWQNVLTKTSLDKYTLMQPVYLKQEDLPNNLDLCDTRNLNKVWVVRKGVNYGTFEVDHDEKTTFASCFKSNYLLTGLSNYFNERSNSNSEFVSSWISSTYIRCTYSHDIIYDTKDVVYSSNGLPFHKNQVEYLKSRGVDDLDLLNDNYVIQSYGTTPSLNFDKFSTENNPLYLGVELEVDSGSVSDEDIDDEEYDDSEMGFDSGVRNLHSQMALSKIAKGKQLIYSKTDGSLNYGFEMVSHPLTLAKHTKGVDWKSGMDMLTKIGYRSHNTTTCGLHVHINRNFFGSSATANINGAKIAYLLEKNINDVVKFTRRKDYLLGRWARFGNMQDYMGDNASAKTRSMLTSAFKRYYPARQKYVALNTMHSKTFEFRIFRGTLNYGTFLATLQLVDNLAHIVRDIPNNNDMFSVLDQITFDDIVNFRPYAELTTYWNKRKGE